MIPCWYLKICYDGRIYTTGIGQCLLTNIRTLFPLESWLLNIHQYITEHKRLCALGTHLLCGEEAPIQL